MLRDRIVGILLGNLLMSIVFSMIWPISALDRARAAIAQALRALGDLMRDAAHPPADVRLDRGAESGRGTAASRRLRRSRRTCCSGTSAAREFRGNGSRTPGPPCRGGLRRRRPIRSAKTSAKPARMQDAATSTWFADAAQRFAADSRRRRPRIDRRLPMRAPVCPRGRRPRLRAAIDARVFLQREIEHVAAISSLVSPCSRALAACAPRCCRPCVWAADALQLAPDSPDKPWVIPSPAEAVTANRESNT